jgi:RHS repeat-associated protein
MIVQENHYDPFGQNLPDIELANNPDCLDQYTGKERITNEGLEWTDFGARMYDAQLGRWHSPDPAAQYASPFNAMGNK